MTENDKRRLLAAISIPVCVLCLVIYFTVQKSMDPNSSYLKISGLLLISITPSLIAVTIAAVTGWWFYEKVLPSRWDGQSELSRAIAKEVDITERAISSARASTQKPKQQTVLFPSIFEKSLKDHSESIHVAIMTMEALNHYRSDRIKKRWAGKNHSQRRRIVILLQEQEYKDSYDSELPSILKEFETQGEFRLVEMGNLSQNLEYLPAIKDCAVFDPNDKAESMTVFLSYLERSNLFRFSKSPNSFFKFRDEAYAKRIKSSFEAIWQDEVLKEQSNALREHHLLSSSR